MAGYNKTFERLNTESRNPDVRIIDKDSILLMK